MTRTSGSRATGQNGHPSEAQELDCTYNLFRNAGCEDLVCAVPVDRPVPTFVTGPEWHFVRTIHPFDRLPPGFLAEVSKAARFNGFYLFSQRDGFLADDFNRSSGSDNEVKAHVRAILKKLGTR